MKFENTKTEIKEFCYEDLEREDVASKNFMLAAFAYAAFFGKREIEMTPCVKKTEEERRAIYKKYLEEIQGFLFFDKGNIHIYETRKAQLRGMYSGLDRKGTKVDDMPIFKHIDDRIQHKIGAWKE